MEDFGLIIEKNILLLGTYNQYYSEALMMIGIILFCLLLAYFLEKISGKNLGLLNIIIPLLMFTSPIFVEQFIYIIQAAEIAFGFCLIVIALMLLYEFIINKSIIKLILSIALTVIIIGTYQSFCVCYIMLSIISFLLFISNKKIFDGKIVFKILILAISFIISFIIYECVLNIFNIKMEYLNENNYWKINNYDFEKTYDNIFQEILKIINGESIFYTKSLLVGLVLFLIISIYKTIKLKFKIYEKIILIFVDVITILSPFSLIIYTGGPGVIRSYIYLPFALSLLFIYIGEFIFNSKFLDKLFVKKTIEIMFILIIIYTSFTQSYYLFKLYYTNDERERFDIISLENINLKLKEKGAKDGDIVIFIGNLKCNLNESCLSEEELKDTEIGSSHVGRNFFVMPYNYFGTEVTISNLKNLGYNYTCAQDLKYYLDASKSLDEDTKCWPEEGSVVKMDDYYIVILSNENLNYSNLLIYF